MQLETPEKVDQQQAIGGHINRPLLLTPEQDIFGYVFGLVGQGLLLMVTLTSVVAVLLILAFIVIESVPFIRDHGLIEMLGSTQWYPQRNPGAEFGALAIIIGSLYVTLGALMIAVPIGLLAAVFLSDIVSFRWRQVFKPIIEIMAAIPSVAYGFFAVLVLAPWLQKNLGISTGTNALNASIMLSIMAIPTIVSIAEDAISSVGRDMREGAYSLGASRAETMIKVVIPAGHSGVIAAIILGMMRAIGETMVVWMASGNAAQVPSPWWDITQSIRTMTATIAGEMGETAKNSDHYHSLFAIGLILLVMTFGMNLASEYFLARAKRISTGGGK
ncbi:MAG: phosphate ABC transporter permease subunit PstC [Phycisphaerae bacterium]